MGMHVCACMCYRQVCVCAHVDTVCVCVRARTHACTIGTGVHCVHACVVIIRARAETPVFTPAAFSGQRLYCGVGSRGEDPPQPNSGCQTEGLGQLLGHLCRGCLQMSGSQPTLPFFWWQGVAPRQGVMSGFAG
ncbi:hypothetical protein HJG60_012016 [Phyllostomus discolor]|uniref:Uncharacterized protein n=1 Tax=Phyllostomus discolor TaxID=89673 RepID=A0A834DW82_9CHIR|nr:hypothetical protein HJG60_012016 [Phyllostomus discolor]